MAYLEGYEVGALVPHFALCLFAGIRPCIRYGEISKLRPESVRLDTGTIHIEPEVSKVSRPTTIARLTVSGLTRRYLEVNEDRCPATRFRVARRLPGNVFFPSLRRLSLPSAACLKQLILN